MILLEKGEMYFALAAGTRERAPKAKRRGKIPRRLQSLTDGSRN